MTVFEFYSCVMRLPVSIDSVADFLRDNGFVSEVYFSEVDIDPDILWAQMRSYYPTTTYNADIPPIVEIMYSKHLSLPQRRLACCKELLHSLDDDNERAQTEEQVETLIQQMSIPLNAGFSLPTANDKFGVVKALMVLLPRDALSELRPAFEKGEISEGEISKAVGVPVEYVRLTLSPTWDTLCASFLNE